MRISIGANHHSLNYTVKNYLSSPLVGYSHQTTAQIFYLDFGLVDLNLFYLIAIQYLVKRFCYPPKLEYNFWMFEKTQLIKVSL